MRLPFGLGRRSSSGDGASGDGSGARSGGAPARPAASSRAWASLPPIQRTAGAMPLVAAPGTFAGALPGSQGLPPIVQPLGHEVSALATPGLVVARARPVEAPASGTIPAPVQRRASRGAAKTLAVAEAMSPAEAEAVEAVPDAPPPAAPPSAPIRTMPTVSRVTIRMPDRPLTSAAVAARPAAVQRAASAAAGAPAPALPSPASGGMRRVPSATANPPTVSRQAAERHAPQPAPTAAPASPLRVGLGEPLAGVPASARPLSAQATPLVARSAIAGRPPVSAASVLPRGQRSRPEDAAPTMPAVGPGGAPAVASPAMPFPPTLPHLSVARQTGGVTGGAPAPVTAQRSTARLPGPSTPEIRPIAAANPIRPTFALQRAAAEDLEDDTEDDALPSPWWAPAAEALAHQPTMGTAPGGDAGASVQRSMAGGSGHEFSGLAASPGTSHAAPGPAQPAARGTAVQRSSAALARPSMPVRGAADHSHGPSAAAAPAAEPSITFPSRSIVGAPIVQTTPANGANAALGPSLAPPPPGAVTVQRAEDSSPTPAPPAGGTDESAPRSERDLDELAQALFGRIRGRIRSELIHDREAKGLTFDSV